MARSIKYFMTKENIALNIQRELVKLLNHPKMLGIVESFIIEEYDKLKGKALNEFLSESDKDDLIKSIGDVMQERINIQGLLNKPIVEFNEALFISFKQRGKYRLKDNTINYLAYNMGRIMDKLQLAVVIKKHIESYQMDHL